MAHIRISRDYKGRSYIQNEAVCLDVWKHCKLPDTKVKLTDVKQGKGDDLVLTLEASAPAFYVWLAVANDPAGRFDDNAFTMLPGTQQLTYHPGVKMNPAEFKKRLTINDLRNSY